MTRNQHHLSSLVLIMAAFGCSPAGGGETNDELREAARRSQGKADDGADLCRIYGWYGDDVCDEFCVDPDPDCSGTLDCASICNGPRNRGCFTDEECLSFCEEALVFQSLDAQAAFIQCTQTDPLCFRAPQDCINELIEEPAGFDCDAVCSGVRESKACFADSECLEFCEGQIAGESEELQAAFTECALEDPLCFRRMDDCVSDRAN